jgi:hypothetical protein
LCLHGALSPILKATIERDVVGHSRLKCRQSADTRCRPKCPNVRKITTLSGSERPSASPPEMPGIVLLQGKERSENRGSVLPSTRKLSPAYQFVPPSVMVGAQRNPGKRHRASSVYHHRRILETMMTLAVSDLTGQDWSRGRSTARCSPASAPSAGSRRSTRAVRRPTCSSAGTRPPRAQRTSATPVPGGCGTRATSSMRTASPSILRRHRTGARCRRCTATTARPSTTPMPERSATSS